MADFSGDYTCPDCQHEGAPISGEACCEQFERGWHVTCPNCGLSVQGKEKATVMRAISVLATWQGRITDLVKEIPK